MIIKIALLFLLRLKNHASFVQGKGDSASTGIALRPSSCSRFLLPLSTPREDNGRRPRPVRGLTHNTHIIYQGISPTIEINLLSDEVKLK